MIKKLAIGTLAGTVVYFLFGWVVFEFILGDYTGRHTIQLNGFRKTDADYSLLFLIVSCMAYAALISYVLMWLLNTKDLLKGFCVAATIGALVAVMADTYWYATSYFYSNFIVVILDIVAAAVTVGVLGLAVTWLNRTLK